MKKTAGFLASVFVISSLCLFAGCNKTEKKNESVKRAEDLISQIGTVSIDSWDEIEAAESAINSLSDSDYESVDNKRQLELARETFNEIIDDYNRRIEEARLLANNTDLMSNVAEGIDALVEIRSELPDEVLTNYIVFNDDISLDEFIENYGDVVSSICYPDTTVMTFDFWYYHSLGAVASLSNDGSDKDYEIMSANDPRWYGDLSEKVDYLWDVKYAYDDYIRSEGYSGTVTCGIYDIVGISVTIR